MSNNVLPADITALLDIGVDKWHAQASWPVSEEEFSNLSNVVFQSYGEMLDTLPHDLQDVFLVDLRFVSFLPQYFHAAAVKERSNHASIEVSYGNLARPFYEPDWSAHAEQYNIKLSPFDKVRFRIREAIRKFRFNRHLPVWQRCLAVFKKSKCWSFGVFDSDKREYLSSDITWIESPFLENFLSNASKHSTTPTAQCRSAVEKYLDDICAKVQILDGMHLPIAEIADTWVTRLINLHEQYSAVMTSNRKPELVLVSGLGDPANRIMALAAKRAGAHVVAFSHGNDTGRTENITQSFLEYAVCNEFVSISQPAADFHTHQLKQSSWKFCSQTTFSALKTDQYQRKFSQIERGEHSIKNVMLMGFPMHPQRYVYGKGEFFQFRLSAELDVARVLREAGYRVLYKAHPETIHITEQIMNSRVDEIVHAPFESELQRADCLVFTYPLTTTFGASLATDIPIVLLDHKGRKWVARAYEMLKHRCALVSTSLDENGKNRFCENELLDAIEQSPQKMDHSYLNEYMSPATKTVPGES
ncbi:MAG: hypothetical protein HON65_02425 [Rhodospirillales bacterium]|jgi:hypothetical protein|nr:hypothetical protein [Rhodospirillales bacterium]